MLASICARHGLRVRYQRRDRSIPLDEARSRPHAGVIPDLLVDRPASDDRALAIDAEYKQRDERKLSNEDVDRTFLCAFVCGWSPVGDGYMPRGEAETLPDE